MDKKMSVEELRDNIIDFLWENKSGSLATCMNNVPRSSPVKYFLGKDMEIFILSAGGDKFKAIEQNPNVCLLVNTEYVDYRRIKGVQIFGKAKTCLQDKSIFEEAKVYNTDYELMEREGHNLHAIKITPEEIVYLDSLEDGDRTKQILKEEEVSVKSDDFAMAMFP
ncbi:pyridoxamine 5'-phosphate oxidase family protein [Clostridium bovifaecis]|uniref:Pyridoxamine 5'-phosphate oxidase family protein n=1 Tax=Clostridium bovifaecis TaxID=2184719 RepID=A0A6I6F5N2_9CLOT|nr:pyridoxamine 5'-phosphate oxidase family protein [Clostridium bovifaecis]